MAIRSPLSVCDVWRGDPWTDPWLCPSSAGSFLPQKVLSPCDRSDGRQATLAFSRVPEPNTKAAFQCRSFPSNSCPSCQHLASSTLAMVMVRLNSRDTSDATTRIMRLESSTAITSFVPTYFASFGLSTAYYPLASIHQLVKISGIQLLRGGWCLACLDHLYRNIDIVDVPDFWRQFVRSTWETLP